MESVQLILDTRLQSRLWFLVYAQTNVHFLRIISSKLIICYPGVLSHGVAIYYIDSTTMAHF